jgi:hypothetical protein
MLVIFYFFYKKNVLHFQTMESNKFLIKHSKQVFSINQVQIQIQIHQNAVFCKQEFCIKFFHLFLNPLCCLFFVVFAVGNFFV